MSERAEFPGGELAAAVKRPSWKWRFWGAIVAAGIGLVVWVVVAVYLEANPGPLSPEEQSLVGMWEVQQTCELLPAIPLRHWTFDSDRRVVISEGPKPIVIGTWRLKGGRLFIGPMPGVVPLLERRLGRLVSRASAVYEEFKLVTPISEGVSSVEFRQPASKTPPIDHVYQLTRKAG